MTEETATPSQEAVAPDTALGVTAPAAPEAAPAQTTTQEPAQQAAPVQDTPPPEHWLPEDLRGNERLKDFSDPASMAKAFADATLAPEVPENYAMPEGAPEGLSKWGQENGFTQAQMDSILGKKSGMDKAQADMKTNVYEQGLNTLYETWGDKKDINLNITNRVFNAVPSGKKVLEMIQQTGEGNNPVIVEFLHEIGSMMQEGGFIPSGKPPVKDNRSMAHRMYPNDVPNK